MENPIEKLSKIQPDFDFDDRIDLSDADGLAVSAIVRDASSEGTAAQAGVQTNRLQSAIENYARAMDKSAIAKSTGLPVKTSSQQYKGFIAEEYFKHTLKINALAKGIPDWKMGVYTNGTLPDGSVLSGIDEHVDISDWTRKHPWSKPMRTVDYQSKIFNDASKYKKVFNGPKYQNAKHVGGAGQGVNDTVEVSMGRSTVHSDNITPADAVIRADQAKAKATPEYDKRQEKFDELNRVNLGKAVAVGAATGAAIGSSLGPIGTVVGSALGGTVIGIGANAIIGTANKDAIKAYTECIEEINTHIELGGCAKMFYFADAMESLTDFRLSFKDLLPCYNLISDLKEYNLHKKALKSVTEQLEDYTVIDVEKKKALKHLEEQHNARLNELREVFAAQRAAMVDDFRESINTYAAASYMQFLDVYQVMQGKADLLLAELESRMTEHSAILEYMQHRNEINEQLNALLNELISEGPADELVPFIDKLTWFMSQDILLVGRQYVSFDEALYLVCGESIG